uniref:Protein yippee-like n=1 Tax=Kalanchoe fedtschenkoi TaxID=63787 RepID=A0A7N0UJ54_KALFE
MEAQAPAVGPWLYRCFTCRNNVALHDDVISTDFRGYHGRAYLFYRAMNITTGPNEDKQFVTGQYTVADVFCNECKETLGWKYVHASEEEQKYKEGKIILEKAKIVKETW